MSPSPLSPQLLSEIFPQCVVDAKTRMLGTRNEAPLVLCWVCKEWRSMALSTPRLWTNLDCSGKQIWRKKGVVELAELWLKNSRTLPLQFSLCWPYDTVQHIAAIAVMNRLIPHISRWEIIAFSLTGIPSGVIWTFP
ncbi:hypothetical protein C8J56DRAFT_388224 [Mycena floridula]|nr:hypothetical protein C8J56DRAFT_388224 [Mycena floridula]